MRISLADERRKPQPAANPKDHPATQGFPRCNITHEIFELTMPSVLIGPYLLRNQPGRFREILTNAGFDLIDPVGDFSLTADQLAPFLPAIDALIAGGERMGRAQLASAPRLRVIARTGVGYDLIDMAGATEHKVAVTI